MPSSRPMLVRNGRLDRDVVAAELGRCLETLIAKAGFELTYEIRRVDGTAPDGFENPEILVLFRGSDQSLLLERGAELLKALEYLAVRWLRLDPQFYDRVRFDAGGYRAMHLEELKLSARVAAERVRETRSPFRFNPMPARDRRILHLALKDEPGVRTSSEGVGEERQLVVFPADAN